MKIIVGLGNPGAQYAQTRHNIGFMAIDEIHQQFQGERWKNKYDSTYSKITVDAIPFLLIKPQTFMNNSGVSVRKWMDYYHVAIDDIYIVYDDMDIPFNELKLKTGGSAGGHNGLKSLISHLLSDQFHRIRLGIGRPHRDQMIDHVLTKFTKMEHASLYERTFIDVAQIVEQLGKQSFPQLMTIYNQKRRLDI